MKNRLVINEIQGNSLVNYAQDSDRELILNGDIDLEGSVLSTTESNGGLIDIELQGNTFVNLANNGESEVTLSDGTDILSSETGYVVATNTVSGQIDNLSLQGKTLVNLAKKSTFSSDIGIGDVHIGTFGINSDTPIKQGKDYTFIINVTKNTTNKNVTINDTGTFANFVFPLTVLNNGINVLKLQTKSNIVITDNSIWGTIGVRGVTVAGNVEANVIILEGDYTQSPPSYFSGLASVGHGLDKLEVLSVKSDGNLFDINKIEDNTVYYQDTGLKGTISTYKSIKIKVSPNTNYYFTNPNTSTSVQCVAYKNGVRVAGGYNWRGLLNKDCDEYAFSFLKSETTSNDFILSKGTTPIPYVPYQAHKKQISFYGTDGKINTLSVLRGINNSVYDEIVEKNGKYYYIKRCEKVVLNGSDTGVTYNVIDVSMSNVIHAQVVIPTVNNFGNGVCVSDRFRTDLIGNEDVEHLRLSSLNIIKLYIQKSKLTTQDVAGFKAWLQANPTTVVYQLSTPLTYECVNLDLDSYANETSVICNSGAISPTMSLYPNRVCQSIIKPSTTYTCVYHITKNNSISNLEINLGGSKVVINNSNIKDYSKVKTLVTTPSTLVNNNLVLGGKDLKVSKVMLFEGDYTSKPTPDYMTGLKGVVNSSGKLNTIVSSKNLFNLNKIYTTSSTFNIVGNSVTVNQDTPIAYGQARYKIKLKPNTIYTLIGDITQLSGNTSPYLQAFVDEVTLLVSLSPSTQKIKFQTPSDFNYIMFRLLVTGETPETGSARFSNIMLLEGDYTSNLPTFEPYTSISKEITLPSPLNSLPNGVKDTVEKIGTAWYHVQRCGQITFNGSENWGCSDGSFPSDDSNMFWVLTPNSNNWFALCDKFINKDISIDKNTEGVFNSVLGNDRAIYIRIFKYNTGITNSDTIYTRVQKFKTWLSQNPTTVVYQLMNPIYTKITDNEFITYLERTHINTDSIIPCNMVVRNTGYTSLIKPSTTYTVLTNLEQNGNVTINLGGSKVSTSYNKAVITTPLTLKDDKCRLSGKGLKSMNVTVVERDLTNEFSPNYFEKITSVGRLAKNKCVSQNAVAGLIDKYDGTLLTGGSYDLYRTINEFSEIEPRKKYISTCYINNKKLDCRMFIYDKDKRIIQSTTSGYVLTLDNAKYMKISVDLKNGDDINYVSSATFQIEEGKYSTTYEKNYAKYYLGFVSKDNTGKEIGRYDLFLDQPLRGLTYRTGGATVKDKIYIKNKQVIIERNIAKLVLNGSEDWVFDSYDNNFANYDNSSVYFKALDIDNKIDFNSYGFVSCDNFTNITIWQTNNEGIGIEGSIKINRALRIRIKTFRLPTPDVQGLKTWLSQNPTTVLYKLATPTYEVYDLDIPTGEISLDVPEGGNFQVITNLNPNLKNTVFTGFDNELLKSPVELNKVRDVADRLYWDDTKNCYCIEKKIGKVVLNGSESGWEESSGATVNHIVYRYPNNEKSNGLSNIISDIFKTLKTWDSTINEECISGEDNTNKIFIKILKSKLPTQDIAGFKTWLSQNNTTIYYQLATPVIIDLPQYNNKLLLKAPTFKI